MFFKRKNNISKSTRYKGKVENKMRILYCNVEDHI